MPAFRNSPTPHVNSHASLLIFIFLKKRAKARQSSQHLAHPQKQPLMLSQDVTQAPPMVERQLPRTVVPTATANALLVLGWFVLFVVGFGAFVALVL
jgi:hypothetical protein